MVREAEWHRGGRGISPSGEGEREGEKCPRPPRKGKL